MSELETVGWVKAENEEKIDSGVKAVVEIAATTEHLPTIIRIL